MTNGLFSNNKKIIPWNCYFFFQNKLHKSIVNEEGDFEDFEIYSE